MKIYFNFNIFKNCLIEIKITEKYSCDDFEKIIKWIKEKNYISYDKEIGIKFFPTNNIKNLAIAFNSYYNQFQKQEMGLTGEKCDSINCESFNQNFTVDLFNHAHKEITKNLFEKYFN